MDEKFTNLILLLQMQIPQDLFHLPPFLILLAFFFFLIIDDEGNCFCVVVFEVGEHEFVLAGGSAVE